MQRQNDGTLTMTGRELAHSLVCAVVDPAVTRSKLDESCRIARRLGVAVCCVRPSDLRRAAEALAGSRTAVGSTVGFPHGSSTRAVKVHEAREAIEDALSVLGSQGPPFEIDLVVNAGHILSDDWGAVRDEIQAVGDLAHGRGALVNAVFEPAWLPVDAIRRLCDLCAELGIDFVAAGTGYGPRDATAADVSLLRESLPATVMIKAAGQFASFAEAAALFDAGADRVASPCAAELIASCDA